ncbi:MAG: tRNA (adenosine(37)-N6)-dimethylallyltransferase MiaA [Actinomycetes bacterium]|jgi:tRNA dimethylallyltransferase
MTLTSNLVIAVVGPTASGKSDLALDLALALDGEVINADSMQVYQGMDIGTAKLPPNERRGITHHMLDLWPVTQTANVAEYQRLARLAVDDTHQRGRIPILVGGSGLYVRAVVDDLSFPGTDPQIRARLEGELEAEGPQALHARLVQQDPVSAAAISPMNGRRIVRALEVIEVTGQEFVATLPEPADVYPTVQVGLDVPRDQLDERIDQRVDRMWAGGLIDEVSRLDALGLRHGVTARRALGYAQALKFLDGEWTQDEAIEHTKRTTRRFARRQDTWFRRDLRIEWIPYDDPNVLERALDVVRKT